ncbi:MAG TPA: class I SAM-dependent methyltransferase [archaeon]|nr:class I SAM-dependent methyltransferase [archaeon]
MIENIKTKKHSEVRNDYDKAYRSGTPFLNPEWFIRSVKNIVDKNTHGKTLLDIGCGDGHFLSYFKGYNRYGIDLSREAIKKAKSHAQGEFRVSSAEKLPFKDNFFHALICMGSMEHFIDIERSLREMKRVSKKGAVVVIHVPNSLYLVNRVLGIDTHHQINERFATEAEWKKIISPFFSVEKTVKYNTRWYLKLLPKKYSCHFTFVCRA